MPTHTLMLFLTLALSGCGASPASVTSTGTTVVNASLRPPAQTLLFNETTGPAWRGEFSFI